MIQASLFGDDFVLAGEDFVARILVFKLEVLRKRCLCFPDLLTVVASPESPWIEDGERAHARNGFFPDGNAVARLIRAEAEGSVDAR